MSTTISVNDQAVVHGLSPYNWYQNGSASIQTPNPGAFDTFGFTGTSIGVTVDTSAMVTAGYASNIYPVLKWYIDGVLQPTHQIISTDTLISLASSLASENHVLILYLMGVDESGVSNRWTPPTMSLVIDNYVLDTGATTYTVPLPNAGYYLSLGDSISEGAVTLGSANNPPSYAQVEDATLGYQYILAQQLNLILGNVAFAGEGWTTGVSSVPGLATTYNLIFAGQSRVFTPQPNLITVNMGTNGTVTAATVTTFMTNLRAACPIAFINMIVPFGQANAANITTGYNNYVTGAPTDLLVNLINLGSTGSSIVSANSYDTVHPNIQGHILLAAALLPLIKYPLTQGNGPSLTSRGGRF
jgi:hypothetical protein